MNTDRSLQMDNFSFSLENAPGPQASGPSRFARALKEARFARGWTQAKLAAQISVPKRSIVSWETAERLPSIGMVIVLLDTLIAKEDLSLHHTLLCAYIADDLERQENRKDQQQSEGALLQRLHRLRERVLQLPTRKPGDLSSHQSKNAGDHAATQEHTSPQTQQMSEQQALEPLFGLMAQLQQHPELITVARDFIHELVPEK